MLPLLIFFAIMAIVVLFDRSARERYEVQQRAEVLHELSTVRARLEGGLNSRLYLTDGLISYVQSHPDITQAEFERFVSALVANKTGIFGIQLARASIISHVYPVSQAASVLGVSLLDLPQQREAVLRALETRHTVLAGPVQLIQGGTAFISRTPIYVAGGANRTVAGKHLLEPASATVTAIESATVHEYWGLATLLIDVDTLLHEAGLDGVGAGNDGGAMRYALRGKDGLGEHGEVFYGDQGVFTGNPVSLDVTLPNNRWVLAGIPQAGWQGGVPNAWGGRLGGFLLALFGGVLGWLWTRYPGRLQREVDQATQALRGAHEQLETKVEERTAALRASNAALRESEALLAEAQHIAHIGNWVYEVQGKVLRWSDEVYRLFGRDAGTYTPHYAGILEQVHVEDREVVGAAMQRAREAGEPYSIEYRIELPDGQVRQCHEQVKVDCAADGKPLRIAGTVQDVTRRKQAERQLTHMAYHDPLTGLPNRALMRDRLEHAMAKARRSGRTMALLFLDLDRFKNINDSLGHDVGDRLLVQVARRLKRCKREEDTLARLGGDEFTMLLEDLDGSEQLPNVAQKIRATLNDPFTIDGREMYISSSTGISVYPGDGEDADTLLKHADTAMYRAKELGRDGYQFFSGDMSERAHSRFELENALRLALERDEFVLYYQPIIELASGRIAALEALLRWQRPNSALVEPAEFIAAGEDSGLAVAIGNWVLRAVCRQGCEWLNQGGVGVPRIMVNLSPRQFSQAGLSGDIARLLEDSGLPHACLGLEITENLLLRDDIRVNNVLQRLRDMHIPVAIDDFGKGHAALAYLKRLAITTLKIDREFIREMNRDSNDVAIAEAVIAMGHKLGLRVVAEGVENAQTAQLLARIGCDLVQGYYYSAPVPAAEVPALLLRFGVVISCPQISGQDAAVDEPAQNDSGSIIVSDNDGT